MNNNNMDTLDMPVGISSGFSLTTQDFKSITYFKCIQLLLRLPLRFVFLFLFV